MDTVTKKASWPCSVLGAWPCPAVSSRGRTTRHGSAASSRISVVSHWKKNNKVFNTKNTVLRPKAPKRSLLCDHKVRIFTEYHSVCPLVETGTLPPLSRLRVRGWGSRVRWHTGRQRKSENLVTGERGEGEGGEPNQYDRKKAWSSMNHSILSG